MNPLASLVKPETAIFPLTMLTPLYTGGIGQYGEQIHPSGLLGSIRHFSCLVASAVGEDKFEERVWGAVDQDQQSNQAKRVAIQWDMTGLSEVQLPKEIEIPNGKNDPDPKKNLSRWFFNQALQGACCLKLTRRGINDADWQLLRLALRIQMRHASFGAKDQFGLGVLNCDNLPAVEPLPVNNTSRPAVTNTLWHTAFFKVCMLDQNKRNVNWREALTCSLALRMALRNSLRGLTDSDADEELRHKMMGSPLIIKKKDNSDNKIDKYGSATEVSAVYLRSNSPAEIRVVVQLKPDDPSERTQVMKAFHQAMNQFSHDGWQAGLVNYEWGGQIGSTDKHKFHTISEWINHLAGV